MPHEFTAELLVDTNRVTRCQYLLDNPAVGVGKNEFIFDEKVVFCNGYKMCICVVTSFKPTVTPCWTQGVLFSADGVERGHTEEGDTFLGEYVVYDKGDKYTAIVKEDNSTMATPDDVNHPQHYCVNGLECIDIIEALDLNYHFSNAFKYLWRAGRKSHTHKDIKKAVWYLNRWLEKNPEPNQQGENNNANR